MSQFNLSGKIFFFLGGLFHEVVKLETNEWVLLLIPLHSVIAAGEIMEPWTTLFVHHFTKKLPLI